MHNTITVCITTVYNLYCYMFRHFHVIIREYLHLRLAKLHKFSKLQLLILFRRCFASSCRSSWNVAVESRLNILSGFYSTRQISTLTTKSTKALHMQPQTQTDCTTDCNVERILFYFIVKTAIFKYFNNIVKF